MPALTASFPLPAKASDDAALFAQARALRAEHMGDVLYRRGVIEYSNRCYRNCNYCGIRAKTRDLPRYEMDGQGIIAQAQHVVNDGLPVVSLQAADHLKYDFASLARTVEHIHGTLGAEVLVVIGDIPLQHYKDLYAAGARQAIVKFETSNAELYHAMRPHNHLQDRLALIHQLVDIGYKVSSGFIYGLPGATEDDVERDLELVRSLPLFAASASPFIPNDQSPLKDAPIADLEGVLRCIARLRIDNPDFIIPAVSALNLLTRDADTPNYGQYLGLMAGANLLTVNYTPKDMSKNYVIYDTARHIVALDNTATIAQEAGLSPLEA